MKVTVNGIKVGDVMRRMGIDPKKTAAKYIAAQLKLRADPYTPKQQGTLKDTAQVTFDGENVGLSYNQPYAHYQYYGKVMGPNALTAKGWRSMAKKGGKYYTGRELSYHDAPMRGAKWIDRTIAEKGDQLKADLAKYMNGGKK